MSFDEAVNTLLERCPGALGAAIVDPDGIPVVIVPGDSDLEALGAEYAAVLHDIDQAGRELQHGTLRQFSVVTDTTVIILTCIAAGYFLVVVLGLDAVVGKARFLSRLTGARLYSEIV